MTRTRLIVWIVSVLLVASLIGAVMWQFYTLSRDLSLAQAVTLKAEGERDIAVKANEQVVATLREIKDQQQRDSAAILALDARMRDIGGKYANIVNNRDQLERKNPDVKDFLDSPVPAALRVREPP